MAFESSVRPADPELRSSVIVPLYKGEGDRTIQRNRKIIWKNVGEQSP